MHRFLTTQPRGACAIAIVKQTGGRNVNVSRTVRRFSRLILAVTGGLVLIVALATPASARTPVDPSTLNPPPPDILNPVCYLDGSHISCDVASTEPEVVVDDPSGIVCDGTELLASLSRSVVGKRTYDAAGNLLQRHFRESFDGGTFRNPDTGRVALWRQHDTVIDNLAVPGDLATGTESTSGLWRVWLPDGSTILTDAGRLLFDVATGEAINVSAHHPFDTYYRLGDPSALAPLCAALD
jgi:hypothetical protein